MSVHFVPAAYLIGDPPHEADANLAHLVAEDDPDVQSINSALSICTRSKGDSCSLCCGNRSLGLGAHQFSRLTIAPWLVFHIGRKVQVCSAHNLRRKWGSGVYFSFLLLATSIALIRCTHAYNRKKTIKTLTKAIIYHYLP
jgi:hypothetical protein